MINIFKNITGALSIVLFALFAGGALAQTAPLGTKIVNTATVTYDHPSGPFGFTTNEASFTVVARETPSTIEFFKRLPIAPDSQTVMLNGSDYSVSGVGAPDDFVKVNPRNARSAAAVFSGDELRDKGASTIEQIQFTTPSVTVQNSGQGNSFNIRGIGKTVNGSGVGVGVITYRDGVASFPGYFQNEPFYDTASLEVLRGPQGTFAGQNATGGAVFVTSRNPEFDRFGGYIQGQLGNYDQTLLEGAANLPLSDTLAARIAFHTEERDSFYTVTNGSPILGEPGAKATESYRGSLLWEPTDSLSVLFKTDYNDIDLGGYPATPIGSGGDLFEISTNGPFLAIDETVRSVLNISYEFESGMTLRSITGYQDGTTAARTDLDGTETVSFTFFDKVNERIWSQEVNLISPDEGQLTWIAGAYYQDDLVTIPQGQFVTNQGFDITLEGETPKTTSAIFGQISYDISDQLELQVGARYSESTSGNTGVSAIPALGLAIEQDDEVGDEKVTGKVALNWTVNPNHFLYAFVATGHKAGGLNGPNIAFVPPRSFEPEDVTDLEAGWKATTFDGRLRTQLGAYYNTYKNFQIEIGDPAVPAITSIVNVAGDSTIYGLEASAQARFGAMSLDAGMSLAKSELGKFYAADPRQPRTGPCDPETGPAAGTCVNVGGNAQPYAPEMTLSAGLEYDFDLAGGILSPRIDYSHISETWASIFADAGQGDRLEARNILNAQLTYAYDDWRLQAFATNLTDQTYIASVKAGLRYAGAPRQYGIRLTREF
jgi:iron complex outermembrane receptor protein